PHQLLASLSPPSRVVEDHVERSAVIGGRLDCLDHLVLGRQQQPDRIEILRSRFGAGSDRLDTGHDRVGRVEHASQQVDHNGEHDYEQNHVTDPLEDHLGLPSATTDAFFAIPGSALTITSNWALIGLTASCSGRRCSDSTVPSADASVASFSEVDSSLVRTRISAAASTAMITIASRTLRIVRDVELIPDPRSRRLGLLG